MRQNVGLVVCVPDLECVSLSLRPHFVFDENVGAHQSGFTHADCVLAIANIALPCHRISGYQRFSNG